MVYVFRCLPSYDGEASARNSTKDPRANPLWAAKNAAQWIDIAGYSFYASETIGNLALSVPKSQHMVLYMEAKLLMYS